MDRDKEKEALNQQKATKILDKELPHIEKVYDTYYPHKVT